MRQLDRVITQGPVNFGQFSRRVIRLDPLNPLGVVDLCTEVKGMGLRSVVAIVCLGNHDGEHLALGARER